MSALLIYGAYGYTGWLVVSEAKRQGLSVVLGGRDKVALQKMASAGSLPWRCFDVHRTADHLDGIACVLNCAGPFAKTAIPMLEGCVARGVHYLDITGEGPVFERVYSRHDDCVKAGVVAVPGVGWDVVPTDCLVNALVKRLPETTSLTVAITGDLSRLSGGTRRSAIQAALEMGLVHRADGCLVSQNIFDLVREIPILPEAPPITALCVPLADLVSAYRSTGVPRISCYLGLPGTPMRLMKALAPLLRWGIQVPFLNRLLGSIAGWNLQAMPSVSHAGIKAAAWCQAQDALGHSIIGRVLAGDGYEFTANAAVEAAKRVLAGTVAAGAHTPAQAFGSGFVNEIGELRMVIS